MQTREQEYAVKVFEHVSTIKERGESVTKSYDSMAHTLPVLIRTAGLVQALAFLETRDDQGQQQLLDDLSEVVYHDRADIPKKRDHLLERSRRAALAEYMQLTQKTLDTLLWFKRYAESVLDVKSSDSGGGNAQTQTP